MHEFRVFGIFTEALNQMEEDAAAGPGAPRSNPGTGQSRCSGGSLAFKCRDLAATWGREARKERQLAVLVGIGS